MRLSVTRKPRCGILITKHSIFHMVHSHSIFLAEIFNAFIPNQNKKQGEFLIERVLP